MLSATRKERKKWLFDLRTKQIWAALAIFAVLYAPVFALSIYGANVISNSSFSYWLIIPMALAQAFALGSMLFASFYLVTGILGIGRSIFCVRCQELYEPIEDLLSTTRALKIEVQDFTPYIKNLINLVENITSHLHKSIFIGLIEIFTETLTPRNNSAYSPKAFALNSVSA